MDTLEERKAIEAQFHDRLREPDLIQDPQLNARLTANKKWYSVARKSKGFAESYLRQHCFPGARVLDYACGNGFYTQLMAEAGAAAVGIDISPTSVANAARETEQRGLHAEFKVMDCESLDFPGRTFDFINVSGVLHHLDLQRAYSELARVLKPSGSVLCVEALRHNPSFSHLPDINPSPADSL